MIKTIHMRCQLLSVLFLCYLVLLCVFSCTLYLSTQHAIILPTIYACYQLIAQHNNTKPALTDYVIKLLFHFHSCSLSRNLNNGASLLLILGNTIAPSCKKVKGHIKTFVKKLLYIAFVRLRGYYYNNTIF